MKSIAFFTYGTWPACCQHMLPGVDGWNCGYPGEEDQDFFDHGDPADILPSFNETEFLAETYSVRLQF